MYLETVMTECRGADINPVGGCGNSNAECSEVMPTRQNVVPGVVRVEAHRGYLTESGIVFDDMGQMFEIFELVEGFANV